MQHNITTNQWSKLAFLEQIAHIGSEVERTIAWKEKGNEEYSKLAFFRSLELFDLSTTCKHTYPQLKEMLRTREMWVDFIYFDNEYNSTSKQFRDYFNQLLMVLNRTK